MKGIITEILAAAIQDERTFAEVHALYSETFRDAKTFTVEDEIYSRDELVEYLITPVYKACNPREVIREGWSLEKAEILVDSLEFVEICNYKGEGEGFELSCRVENLRVYCDK